MAVDKFKFLSPGIQVNEIDESGVEEVKTQATAPVIIGRTERGPAMRPVQIDSVAELNRVFGNVHNGNQSGDVWRDGNKQAPTLATIAAEAYLRNSGPVTVVRLLGEQNASATSAGKAGWKITGNTTDVVSASEASGAFGLYVWPWNGVTGSATALTSSGTGTLAAVIYSQGSVPFLYGKTNATGSVSAAALTASLCIGEGTNKNEFVIGISSSAGLSKKDISLDSTSGKFIRNVLNTNPVLTNSVFGTEKYFLGETFEGYVKNTYGSTQNLLAAIVPLKSEQSTYQTANTLGKTSWVVSQDTGVTGSFEANSSGVYTSVVELFRFVTLSGGEYDQKNYKISIENITKPVNVSVDPFGTFDVVIRTVVDNTVLERFNGVNLNKESSKFIAKVIGDSYQEWNSTDLVYETYGKYTNASARIRVEMASDQQTQASLLPFGFYGNLVYTSVSNLSSATGSIENKVVSVATGSVGLPVAYASINMKDSSGATSLSRVRWGMEVVKGTDTDVSDLLKIKANSVDSYEPTSGVTKYSKLFSLDDVVVSGTTATWAEGKRKAGLSYSAINSSLDVLTYADSFDLPLLGGSDGLNILEKEAIINKRILTSGVDETTSAAYETVQRALLAVADPEVVDADIICVPGLVNEALTNKLIDICEQRGDSLALVDIENDYVPAYQTSNNTEVLPVVSTAVSTLKDRALDTSYAAAYFPAVFLSNENIFVPASIAALGVLGGTKGNSALWFAPAGFNRGGLTRTTSGLSVSRTAKHLTSANRDSLYEVSVNPIATFPAEGVVVFGQKTLLASPSALDRVNVRRLMNYVKKEISKAANQVIFEPNVERTWNNFKGLVEPFLDGIKVNFGLDDYRVILDERTTTADLIDRNIMYAKILLKPTRTIEFIALDFVVSNSGAIFEG